MWTLQSGVELYSAARAQDQGEENKEFSERMSDFMPSGKLRAKAPVAYLPDSGQLIRVVPTWQVPKEVYPQGR